MHTRADVFPETIGLVAKQKTEWSDGWHARGTVKPVQFFFLVDRKCYY